MHTNRLADEQSPYLLQHAHNPVDWYPWGEEAFARARAEDKPIFLSIGYSTCHWCHVMERESFESEDIAALLNRDFVSIKLDREERPDIDRIYMLFVQATTGGGGWPMSVWLTPDLKPFYGGTYFPPDSRYGRPGFPTVLTHIARAWREDRQRINESVAEIMHQLESHAVVAPSAEGPDPEAADRGFQYFRRIFDTRYAGFGQAPKFPRPSVLNFLLRYWAKTDNEEALEMAVKTLRAMARGGMNDQLGGGFHRYAVDARWFVPHFEKMLYDQGQLSISYLEAYQITAEPEYADEARRIFDYVLTDMTHRGGGFYSAEDADSVIDAAQPHEKGEGAFYVFDHREILAVLGAEAGTEFARHFGALPEGNVAAHEDPHNEFGGKNILYRATEDAPPFAAERKALLAYRASRIRPHLDDKILSSWNGLMISAFAKGAQVLGEERYAAAARRAAEFIRETLWRPESNTLLRRFRAGEAGIDGFLDDYSFFGLALLDLYETGFDDAHLEWAVQVAESMLTRFEDKENGGFYSTAEGDPSLVMRLKEDYDGAEPSGNSMAALLLLRLEAMTGREDFGTAARRTLAAFAERLAKQTPAVPQMLCAALLAAEPPRQIQFAGEGFEPLAAAAHSRFAPFQVLLRAERREGAPEAQICENFVCSLAIADPTELIRRIE
jgi:uncharacterized protein